MLISHVRPLARTERPALTPGLNGDGVRGSSGVARARGVGTRATPVASPQGPLHALPSPRRLAACQPLRSWVADLRQVVPDAEVALRCLEIFDAETRALHDRIQSLEAAQVRGWETIEQHIAEVRQKDTDVRQKDADMRQKDAHLQALNDALRQSEVEGERVKADLKEARTDLLAEQGMLHMRGAIEYVEAVEAGRLDVPPGTGREELWQNILRAHPDLARCLLAKNPTRKRPKAPVHERAAALMPALYDALSLPLHPVFSPENVRANGPLTVVMRTTNPRHAGMVACICEHYYLNFDLISRNGQRTTGYRGQDSGLPGPCEGPGA